MAPSPAVGARLDDPAARARTDPADALGDVERTPELWKTARDVALPAVDLSQVRLAVVAGVGGSGVAADVVAALAAQRAAVPVITHKRGTLPSWVGPGVLVVACSHSGGTTEVRAVAAAAADAGAQVVTLSAGGPLAALAAERRLPAVVVPGGPPPRHALASLVVPLLRLLGLDGALDEAVDRLDQRAGALGREVPVDDNPAKQLGAALADGRVPVVFGGPDLAAVVAARLKTQLNENAKLPVLAGALPDLAHHEVMGWERPGPLDERVRLVWVRDPLAEEDGACGSPPPASAIAEVSRLLARRGAPVTELTAEGESRIERLATLLLGVDLVSVYAALARGVDPSPIATIDALKALPCDEGPARPDEGPARRDEGPAGPDEAPARRDGGPARPGRAGGDDRV
jgi:glucose/mannose-6-phosphate isomerase